MDGRALYFPGIDRGVHQHDQPPSARREMYNRDITYGTNSEMGFDYLRDNGMAQSAEEQVQRGHYFAIVDEVDSILIDEARTPLIISGPAQVKQDQRLYSELKPRIQDLVRQQKRLCDKYIREANELIKNLGESENAEIEHEVGLLLYRVQQGQQHSGLLSKGGHKSPPFGIGGNGAAQGSNRSSSPYQKEELFLPSTRKAIDADLTEKGRSFLNPTIQKPSRCRTP